jgi:DNA recombination protein RmuC
MSDFSETVIFSVIILISIIAVALGYVVSMLKSRYQVESLKRKYADLNDKLDEQKTSTSEKFSSVEKMREGLEHSLSSLAGDEEGSADIDIGDKERFVHTLLDPLLNSLQSADEQVKRINSEGEKAQEQIQTQINMLQAPSQLGRGDVKEVAKSLGEGEAREQWGLKTLKELLELTYMTDHYHMCESADLLKSDEKKRDKHEPPCLIELPNNRRIAVEINTSMEAYVNICMAPDASVRTWHLETHARKLRERMMEMTSRAYQDKYTNLPKLKIVLILNDHYLSTALEVEKDLLEFAQKNNLILATPTDLFNLFQTISFAWRQQGFATDAQQIRETGVNLYKRFGTFIKLIAELGSELSGVLNSYNRAVSMFGSTAAEAEKRMKEGGEFDNPLDEEEKKTKILA